MSKIAKTMVATRKLCADALDWFKEAEEMLKIHKKISGNTKKKNSFWALVVKAFGRNAEADRNEFVDDFVNAIGNEGYERLHSFFLLDKFDSMLPLLEIVDPEIDSASLTIDIFSHIPHMKVPKAEKLAKKLADLYVVDDELDSDDSIKDKNGAKMFMADALAHKLEIAVFGKEEAQQLLENRKKPQDEKEAKQKKKKSKKRKKSEANDAEGNAPNKSSPKKRKASASPKNTAEAKDDEKTEEEEQNEEHSEVVTQDDSESE